jgi:hypothetical protein
MRMRSVHHISPVIICSFLVLSGNSHAQQTPALEVVAEYIRQLGTINEIQELSSKEMAASNNNLMDAIRGSTRIKLELRRNVLTFKTMTVGPPFEWLLPSVIDLYEQKIELHDAAIQIASKFTGGTPQPGVDYNKLTAEMPKNKRCLR